MQIRRETTGPVATLVLSDPATRNALNDEALVELREHLDALSNDIAVTTVVLRGEGDAFSSGGSLSAVGAIAKLARNDPEGATERVRTNSSIVERILQQPQLTIALITGPIVGAGLGLAAACDIRLATPKTRLIPAFGAIGLTTDVGTSPMLRRVLGASAANAWLLTGKSWHADASKAAGFVAHVDDEPELSERIRVLAESLPEGSGQRTLRQRMLTLDMSQLSAELDREASAFTESINTEYAQERVRNLANGR